jgi:hypothetical protein
MKNIRQHIENLVSSVLKETIEEKADQLIETAKTEAAEELHGNQKKLDVAEPKGKLTKADFDKLRNKKETTEESYGDTEMTSVKPYGDFKTTKPKVGKVKNSGYDYEHKVAKEFDEADEADFKVICAHIRTRATAMTLNQWNTYLNTLAWQKGVIFKAYMYKLARKLYEKGVITLADYTEGTVWTATQNWIRTANLDTVKRVIFGYLITL